VKNFIISTLIILLLNMQDGWLVGGFLRFLVSIILIFFLDMLINDMERQLKGDSRRR
jgi:hypothetical protein